MTILSATQALEKSLNERMSDPTVVNLFHEWKRCGLLDETAKVLFSLPPEIYTPVSYSLTTHAHKQKGLFIEIVGRHFGVDLLKRRALAVSAEILFALSQMIDDIEDGDLKRGDRESCWAKYGKKTTLNAVETTLKALIIYLDTATSQPKISQLCMKYINLGMESLSAHRRMNLDTPLEQIIRNCDQRNDFHSTFQLEAMSEFLLDGKQELAMDKAIGGLKKLNLSGQLINDIQDIVGNDLTGRSYSDIRNGLPTIPLLDLLKLLYNDEATFLREMFGKRLLKPKEQEKLTYIINKSNVINISGQRIKDYYSESRNLLSMVISEKDMKWFNQWIEYKLKVLKQITG